MNGLIEQEIVTLVLLSTPMDKTRGYQALGIYFRFPVQLRQHVQ